MTNYRYDHLVAIDEASRKLVIFRVEEDGTKTLFTEAVLPAEKGWSESLISLAKQLGENLLLDSPAVRKMLDL